MRNPSIIIGLIMLALLVAVALAGPTLVSQLIFPGERPGLCAEATGPINWIRSNTPSAPTATGATG